MQGREMMPCGHARFRLRCRSQPHAGRSAHERSKHRAFVPSFSPTVATDSVPARPVAARTRLQLEGPVLSTLLRLAAPNVLNLLAIAGMITFDGLFLGRLGPDALAGVSLAFPFVMLIQHTAASGMGGGVSSAIARAL